MTQTPVGRQNGSAMRDFRKKEKLSVVEMAGFIGLKPQSLRNIENGRSPASAEVIRNAARVLGVEPRSITRDGADIADEADPAGAAAA